MNDLPGRPRLIPVNRNQMRIMPVDVERLIPEEHDARAIWDFAGRLDLTPYYEGIRSTEGEAGRPAYDPRVLISVWVYAYRKGIGSAREIARHTEYDPAFQWLTAMEVINYHTLADFRSAHGERLNTLFINVLGLLSAEGLITLERVMHDGSKVKACAGDGSFRRKERIKAHLVAAREQIRLTDNGEASLREQKARQRAAKEKKERLERALLELEKMKNARASMTDPEARIMKGPRGSYGPAYNIQISADSVNDIIVAAGVSQRSDDYGELVPAVERIERTTGKKPGQIVADGGYTSRKNILAMHDRGVDFIGSLDERAAIPAAQFKRRGVDPAFWPGRFSYDEKSDAYTCPAGKTLHHREQEEGIGKTSHAYLARKEDCRSCSFQEKCCPGKRRQRSLVRKTDHPVVAAFIEKMKTEEAKAIYKTRGAIAEFPNAWIKEKLGLRQFHLRGLLKAEIETLWVCLTYNIQQWIRLKWRPQLA
jgi:transposase